MDKMVNLRLPNFMTIFHRYNCMIYFYYYYYCCTITTTTITTRSAKHLIVIVLGSFCQDVVIFVIHNSITSVFYCIFVLHFFLVLSVGSLLCVCMCVFSNFWSNKDMP